MGRLTERQQEQQREADSILVADTVRLDANQRKADAQRKNAEYLQTQMQERRERDEQEKITDKAQPAGYWGPEEKPAQAHVVHRNMCTDLIKQMEVDQGRRLDSRGRRLRQERRLIDNCTAEMMQDRERECQKNVQHREVLLTTWASQQRIKEAVRRLDRR